MSRTCRMSFELLATDGKARRGRLTFPRGTVETPAFMPVGTYGTVKGMLPRDIEATGAEIILGNTFHLWLRPGTEVIKKHGDLHDFMQWKGPILTDSGGFQVFSLGAMRKIKEEGVTFASPVDGAKVFMGPEESMQVQRDLGSDIVMIFDECTPYPADEDVARISMELSLRWAQRSKNAHGENTAALFGIVQGGMHQDLRMRSLEGLDKIGFDGLAIGGLSVGEPKHEMIKVLDYLPGQMPADKPRYLMGVGKPEDLVEGVRRGVDMFDCVMPTRNARNGQLFIDTGVLKIRNASIAMMIRRSIRPAIAIPARTSPALICIIWTSAAKCWGACSIPSITCVIIKCLWLVCARLFNRVHWPPLSMPSMPSAGCLFRLWTEF